jgi:predicted CoA-binding protein
MNRSMKVPMSDLLESALDPQSVAVIGASENIHKIGGRPIYYMQKHGFAGRIYPINPAREEVQGLKSYASLAALARGARPGAGDRGRREGGRAAWTTARRAA